MRPGLVVAVVALTLVITVGLEGGRARAAAMPHYDLAGLVLESDAVVVATRSPSADGPSRYRVTRSIRGSLAVGAELAIDDRPYGTAGHAVDAEVVAFLRRDDRGGWFLTLSGLRVTEGGKVYRFEQWNNPGGFTMVAQGHDPADAWNGDDTAIDRVTLERELALAIARADGVAPALALTDPARRRAAAFALLPPAGVSEPGMGFYRDEVSARIAAGLAAAGDLDGALDARARDRSGPGWSTTLAPAPALVAIAAATTAPGPRRVAALEALRPGGLFADAADLRAVLALVDDGDPAVRIAAIATAATAWGWGGGRGADAAINRRLAREVARALAARFAREADGAVLHALAAAHAGRRMPSRRGGPAAVAGVRVVDGALQVDVRCLGRHRLRPPATLTADGAAAPGWIAITCGADQRGVGTGAPVAWSVGAHRLAVTVVVDRTPVTLPLGTLTADGRGELTLTRP